MLDEEKLQQNAELQQKIEKAKIENMRMREEIAAIREEHNYWRALYHTTAINAMQGLLASCGHEVDVKRVAEIARFQAKELIKQLREEKSSQKL